MSTQSVGRHALLEHAARWLQLLVDRGRRSDGLLQSAQTWEAQYAAGRWDFLGQLPELARFSSVDLELITSMRSFQDLSNDLAPSS